MTSHLNNFMKNQPTVAEELQYALQIHIYNAY